MATQHPLALYLKVFGQSQDTIDELQRELQVLEDEHDAFLRNFLAGRGTSSAATQVLRKTVALKTSLNAATNAKDQLRNAVAAFIQTSQPVDAALSSLGAAGPADASPSHEPLSLDLFQESYRQARDQLQDEFNKQQDLAQNAPTEADRLVADDLAARLQSKLKELRDEKDAFLTKVALIGNRAIIPRDDVVRATITLNQDLANVIVDANRAGTMLNIVTSFLVGAIQVFNGSVPPTTES